MPQTYSTEQSHRRSSSAPMPQSDPVDIPPLPLDVDDSIVLSDLLRTGEASRLRRRGAMRIDHNHPHHIASGGRVLPGPRLPSPNIVLVERSNWDSDSDLDSPSFTSHWTTDQPRNTRFSSRRHPRSSRRFGPYGPTANGAGGSSSSASQAGAKEEEFVYSLVCGSVVSDSESDHVEPFTPSVLPLYPPPSPPLSSKQNPTKKTTGCGAIIHVAAAPKSRFRMWTARTPASEAVIPLDGCYFDAKEASRFLRNQCGCVSEGVGCAICGNPLGTRYTPCKSASEGFFCSRVHDKSHPIDGPSSPKSHHTKPKHCFYSFFSDSVSSSPPFSFPSPPVRPSRSRSFESQSRPVSPPPPPGSPPLLPPERYLYSPYDEDESDSENYPPYNASTGSYRAISLMTPSLADTVAAFGNPPLDPSTVPRDGMFLDRTVDIAPAPMLPEDESSSPTQSWGVNPTPHFMPQVGDPGSSPLRTRTGRTARWSSLGRSHPSLSSGLGGTVHDERPISPLSFYDRQLMVASEREGNSGLVEPDMVNGNLALMDPDGELPPWGTTTSDTVTESTRHVHDEYKPADYFDR